MENEELLPLKRELSEKAASKQLDSYGYYLYAIIHHLLYWTICCIAGMELY